MRPKIIVSWSGGKDSALTLQAVRESGAYEVVGLLTTVTEEYDRISMHGVRRVLLEQQAAAVGLPVEQVFIAPNESNEAYEVKLRTALERFKEKGVSHIAGGDLFLEELRKYREEKLSLVGIEAVFPLWGRNTRELAQSFLERGFKAVITCVDTQALEARFAGRRYDAAFLAELPSKVDPCGENGEFHSFVYAGPGFQRAVVFSMGESVLRDGRFQFCDLLPRE